MIDEKIAELHSEIAELRNVCRICINLLSFNHSDEFNRQGLRNALSQIIEKENYNKVKTIERISTKATGAPGGETNIREAIKRVVYNQDKLERIYDRYFRYTRGVDDVQRLLKNSVSEIVEKQEEVKRLEKLRKDTEADKRQREEDRRKREEERRETSYSSSRSSHTSTSRTVQNASIGEIKPLEIAAPVRQEKQIKEKKEVKKRLTFEYKLEDEDIQEIATKYKLGEISYYGFISTETIKEIVDLYDVEVGIQKKYHVSAFKLAKGFETLFKITVEEALLGEASMNGQLDNMRHLIADYGGYDFLERYTRMYDDLKKYIKSLPERERQEFQKEFIEHLDFDLKEHGQLLTPEAFRQKVNEKITERLITHGYISSDNLGNLSRQTKYMTADEIANIYRVKCNNNPYTTYEMEKNACTQLILLRMPRIDVNDPEKVEKIDERVEAILKDYFYEYLPGSKVADGYARKLVEQKELIVEKRKQYFRMSKFKQALASMKYQRIVDLSKRSELSTREENELRRMF